MSIPVFFETYKIPVSRKLTAPDNKTKELLQEIREEQLKKIWKDQLNWKGKIPREVQFVDGGALSNFPINVFYNPAYIIPRMPTFGVRLGDKKEQGVNKIKSIGGYVSAIISTLRGNTDKDFINKNKAFELGVEEVDLAQFFYEGRRENDDIQERR
jgi:NTE family protein